MTDVMIEGATGMIAAVHRLDGHAVDIVDTTQIQDGHVTRHLSETCLHGDLAVDRENEVDHIAQTPGHYLGHRQGQSHGQSLQQLQVNILYISAGFVE